MGAPKKCRYSCVGMRVFFVQRTTASHSNASIYIYVPERYAGHRHYWNRVAIYSYLRAESASRAK